MPRRFRFRLETVQRLREQARDAQRRALAQKVREVALVEQRMTGFGLEWQQTMHQLRRTHHAERIDIALVRDQHVYRGWLRRRIAESHTELSMRRNEFAAEQAKLAEATKQLRVIERLHERQWQRHRENAAREEQAQTDEIASNRHRQLEADPHRGAIL